jgi:hypothetical protein
LPGAVFYGEKQTATDAFAAPVRKHCQVVDVQER